MQCLCMCDVGCVHGVGDTSGVWDACMAALSPKPSHTPGVSCWRKKRRTCPCFRPGVTSPTSVPPPSSVRSQVCCSESKTRAVPEPTLKQGTRTPTYGSGQRQWPGTGRGTSLAATTAAWPPGLQDLPSDAAQMPWHGSTN
jgi:hypothetical protein